MKNRTCNLGHNLESRYKYLKGLYTNFQLTISEGCVWFLPVLFKHTSTNEENVTVFFLTIVFITSPQKCELSFIEKPQWKITIFRQKCKDIKFILE